MKGQGIGKVFCYNMVLLYRGSFLSSLPTVTEAMKIVGYTVDFII